MSKAVPSKNFPIPPLNKVSPVNKAQSSCEISTSPLNIFF